MAPFETLPVESPSVTEVDTSNPVATPETVSAADSKTTAPAGLERLPGAVTEAVDAEKPETPVFKAKEKFAVTKGSGRDAVREEFDVPARFKEIMKDAESEKEVLELLTAAGGLPVIKEKLSTVQAERNEVRQQHQAIMGQVQDLRETYQRGDIDQWLQKLGIPSERMLQWALDKVQYSQLPPEQQKILDEKQEAQRQAVLARKQVGDQSAQVSEQLRNAKSMLLDAGLASPDVKSLAEAFDAKTGREGSFRDEVIAAGQVAWAQSNGTVDLSPQQAIDQVTAKFRKFVETPALAPQATGAPLSQNSAVAPAGQQKPQVIPNVRGGSQSPMKSKPTSLDDLKKLRKESQARA